MNYSVNFGRLAVASKPTAVRNSGRMRLAFLGDFSGRANRGALDIGEALAARKPLPVDADNLDEIIRALDVTLTLPLGPRGGARAVALDSLDAFHPDELYGAVDVFAELAGLRRRLNTTGTFQKAAAEVQSWAGDSKGRRRRRRAQARGGTVPASGRLTDFAQLVGRPVSGDIDTPAAELMRHLVGPHVVPAADPRQDALVAQVDEALAGTMRRILHHPDFQTLESLWRSVDMLVRRLETGGNLQIVLYDISAEEIAADLAAADDLEESGLYKLLVERPRQDAAQGPLGAALGLYTFEETPPHAELLGRTARIAAAAGAPFVTGIGTAALDRRREAHPLVVDAWDALRAMPEAAWLGLTAPRFLLRMPYGMRTDPIDSFAFEEFTPRDGLGGMLWGHPAVVAGLLIGQTWAGQGQKMKLGSVMTVGEMPYYVHADADGDQTALPCTERLLSVREAEQAAVRRIMPLLSIRGRPEIRLGSFGAVGGGQLSGPWPAEHAPEARIGPSNVRPAAEAEDSGEEDAMADESDLSDDDAMADESDLPDDDGEAESGDDLDSLLASFDDDEPDGEDAVDEEPDLDLDLNLDDDEMDPELAALLKDL